MHINRHLFFTVFITGAAVLVLEVAAVRILAPHYGSSLYVFSSVLTVILAALSVGYWYGGKRADEKESVDELFALIAISGLLVVLLLLTAIYGLPKYSIYFSVMSGPLVFSLALFFVPAFLLGIVSPYIIKLQSLNTPENEIGSVVGKTFFWGTAGSIFGSIASGFWFIPTLGVELSIMLVSIMLVALGVVMPLFLNRPLNKKWVMGIVVITTLFGLATYALVHHRNSAYVYRTDGLYSSIAVEDFTFGWFPGRILHRDTNNSSAIFTDSKELLFPYTQLVLLYETIMPDAESFLLLGGGAYTVPRTLIDRDPDIQFDVVEIEPSLFNIAQEYFDLSDTSRIKNHVGDARVFLAQKEKDNEFDIIFHNAFGTDTSAPFHLTTLEYYTLVREHLSDDGIFFVNFIGKPKGPRPSYTGSVAKTLTAVFPNTRAFMLYPDEYDKTQNIMFVARKDDQPIDIDEVILTDRFKQKLVVKDMELDLSLYDFEKEILLTDDHAPVEKLMAKQR